VAAKNIVRETYEEEATNRCSIANKASSRRIDSRKIFASLRR
jgi:hypothetical protein